MESGNDHHIYYHQEEMQVHDTVNRTFIGDMDEIIKILSGPEGVQHSFENRTLL